jgi:hypothetical protein
MSRAARDLDRAGRRMLEPGHHPKRRRLPAPGRPDQHHQLPVRHGQVERVDGRRLLAERLGHRPELDLGHC